MTSPLTKKQWEASVAEMWSASVKATCQDLIDEAVKAEREACAKLCDYVYDNIVTDEHIKDMAFKIRARGQA
jgi:hypothetical protein